MSYYLNNYERLINYQRRYDKAHKAEKSFYNRCKYIDRPENLCLIENYYIALSENFNGWEIHHRLETHYKSGKARKVHITRVMLIKLNKYFNRPADELIFLRVKEHRELHRKSK